MLIRAKIWTLFFRASVTFLAENKAEQFKNDYNNRYNKANNTVCTKKFEVDSILAPVFTA